MSVSTNRETESLLNDLLESDIIKNLEGESVSLTQNFLQLEEDIRHDMKNGRIRNSPTNLERDNIDEIREVVATWNDNHNLGFDDIDEYVVRSIALHRSGKNWDLNKSVRIAIALRRFNESPTSHGVPNGFIPVAQSEIDLFLNSNPVSVLYVWDDECEPCKIVQEDLEMLVESNTIPEEVGLGAIYAPEGGTRIRENFDIRFVPTLLFFVRDRVDSRLLGKPYRENIQAEIETIAEHLN